MTTQFPPSALVQASTVTQPAPSQPARSQPATRVMAPASLTPLAAPSSGATAVLSSSESPLARTPVEEQRLAYFADLQKQLLARLTAATVPDAAAIGGCAITPAMRADSLLVLSVLADARQSAGD